MSDLFNQLIEKGILQLGIWETVYMTFISAFFAYIIGLPLGVLLCVTDKGGICPLPWLNKILGFIVNIFRSIPFVILMIAMLPAAKFIVGTSLGNKAMIVTLIIAADDSNETRALLLLKQEGLIDLPDGANALDSVTTLDIVDNHGYNITTVQADTVAAQFTNGDTGSLAVINGNYALAAGLKASDAIAIEDASGNAAQTYANIIAVRNGDENNPKIQALINALKTDDVKKFIEDTYNGAVVAIF